MTARRTRWALAEGEVGGARNTKTYVLVSNPTGSSATITVTMLSETQAPETQTYTVGPNSRFNIALGDPGYFPSAVGRRVGLLVESTGVPDRRRTCDVQRRRRPVSGRQAPTPSRRSCRRELQNSQNCTISWLRHASPRCGGA